MSTSPITAAGLLLDMAGAVLLASSLMTKTPKEARRETASFLGGNPFLYLSLAKQRADAGLGGALLVMGFAAQFADNVIEGERPGWLCLPVTLSGAALIVVGAALLLFLVVRPFFVRRAIEESLAFYWRQYHRDDYKTDPDEEVRRWWMAVEGWGRHVTGERHGEESLNDYGRRVLGERRWTRLGAAKPPPTDYVPPPPPWGE